MTDAGPEPGGRGPASAIVGRLAELERADAFLDAATRGFAVLRVHGPAGIGKSTLWREVAGGGLHRPHE